VDTINNQVQILNVNISPITVDELHCLIKKIIGTPRKAVVLHVNAQMLNLAFKRPWLIQFINKSELVFCDGAGVILAGLILGFHIPQRITYADWMWQLAEFSMQNGFSLFFLGGQPGIAEKAAARLKERFHELKIAGFHHGFFDKSKGSLENEAVIDEINALQPDILIVGLGMPLQEQWLMENWERLDARVTLTGGAVFDYISGELRRAPRWMTDHGLEWLGRLIIEPRRLWKRYLVGNPLFLWRVLLQRFGLLHFS
jgi:N-acetylglucosaminyldiphosphoundecaprenol N-acetyl-beta-D-mannosaminyltransferase